MIHDFKVENFHSSNEEQELSFISNKKYSESYSEYNSYYVSNVNCFVGANASGKTNIFKALSFLLWFAEKSFYSTNEMGDDIFSPHKLRENDLTKFEITFDINNKLYRYFLSLKPEYIVQERLEIESVKGFSYLYKLNNDNGVIDIKYNRTNKLLLPINEREENRYKTKKNATFLSFLIGIGYLDELGITGIVPKRFSNVYAKGVRNYNQISESLFLSRALEMPEIKPKLLPYIKSFDFGIANFVNNTENLFDKETEIVSFEHSGDEGSFMISAFDESAGTIKGTYLLFKLLEVLEQGGVAIIDELDARLHYDLARKLISLFANKDSNEGNAQLFFSTHQPLFLNDRDKKQIFLCYKEDCLNTEVYRLDEVEGVRNTENFFEKYLSGEYGATPRIGSC